jgi:hypothetical protein
MEAARRFFRSSKLLVLTTVLATVLVSWGCSFEVKEGQFLCQTADDCPPNWLCGPDGHCYSSEEQFPSDTDVDTDTDADTDTDTDTDTETGTDTDTDTDSDSDTDTDTDTDSDTDSDTDTDTDTDSDTDTDTSICPEPPYECVNPNACENNGGTVVPDYECTNASQVCCEWGDTET